MGANDVYEVTLSGQLFGQQINNIFHYEQDVDFVSTFPYPSYDLNLGFRNQVLPKILALVTNDVLFTSVKVRNLFNSSDQREELISELGDQGGGTPIDTLPPYAAITFSLSGDNAAVKQGSKRLAGIAEQAQDDGIVTTGAAYVAALQDLADQMATPVKSEPLLLSDLFIPVIVKRVREGTPGAYTYRLPSSPAEKVVSRILVAVWDLYVTTQISRKFGVGA